MHTRLSVIFLFTWGVCAFAQNAQNSGNTLSNGGDLVVHLIPTAHPSSLIDLIRKSQLIIDGTVSALEPTVNTRRDQLEPNLETDAIITVNAVLAGTVPNKSAQILLQQTGGHFNNWTETVPQDPLVTPGERYLLFLVADLRTSVPNVSGMPRYAAVGVWAGKVKIVNGLISFSAAASPALQNYNQTDAGTFMQTVADVVSHPYTEHDKGLPINLAPQAK